MGQGLAVRPGRGGNRNKADDLLRAIMRYRRGEGEYDLSDVPLDQRGNVVFDMWVDLEERIKEHLGVI